MCGTSFPHIKPPFLIWSRVLEASRRLCSHKFLMLPCVVAFKVYLLEMEPFQRHMYAGPTSSDGITASRNDRIAGAGPSFSHECFVLFCFAVSSRNIKDDGRWWTGGPWGALPLELLFTWNRSSILEDRLELDAQNSPSWFRCCEFLKNFKEKQVGIWIL